MNTITKFRNDRKGMLRTLVVAAMLLITSNTQAQDGKPVRTQRAESYGNTLNLGLGVGYYRYFGQTTPFFNVNYEFNVARNFTLAPSIGIASYRSTNHYDWAGHHYYYHETVVPIALKGTYYFDELLGAGPDWDFYLGASVGFVYDKVTWDDGYYGSTTMAAGTSGLYLDGHIGAEYHFNKRVGMYLDLSSGISTLGLAIHHR